MLSLSIIDANQHAPTDESFINEVASIVPRWIKWEFDQAGIELVHPAAADVIFLCHSGSVDYPADCRRRLKYYKIEHRADRRKGKPYIITGGAVDATPFTALATADGVSIGEAYLFVRQILDMTKTGAGTRELDDFITDYPHAISRRQILDYKLDAERPWLLASIPAPIARPDEFIDWSMTSFIRTSDHTFHYIASKGCHLKCKFCATTYRQTYRVNPDEAGLAAAMKTADRRDAALYLITNDAAALPYFAKLPRNSQLSSQSLTVKALRDPDVLESILTSYRRRKGTKMLRLGVEGLSERIRRAYGKPVSNAELVTILDRFMAIGVNYQLFYICGSPYETEADWLEFRQFYRELSAHTVRGGHFLKFTAFQAEPPTPLAYFVNGIDYHARFLDTYQWRHANHQNGRLRITNTRTPERRIDGLADALSVDRDIVARIIPASGTVHLAPDIADARRFKSELIDWPLDADRRWHLGESYRKIMNGAIIPAIMADTPIEINRVKLRGGLGRNPALE